MSNQKKFHILLAEDDRNLSKLLKNYLEAKGYKTSLYKDGQEALQGFLINPFDLCILDIMMPQKDGFSLAKEIRARNKEIPIIFLTAKSMHDDVIKGFKVGGDDFITKPFNMEELLARIEAVIRRTKADNAERSIYSIGRFQFDASRQTLTINDNTQKLTSRETQLLQLLAQYKNRVLDRRIALKEIWHHESHYNARNMDVYISKIRKILKQDPSVKLLNVHGTGFKLLVDQD